MSTAAMILMTAASYAAQPQGVILDFTASWCGPCQQMSPIVSRLTRLGYPIRKVDIDHEPQLARKFAIKSIPAFVLIVNNKEVQRHVGLISESRLRQWAMQINASNPPQVAATPKSKPLPQTTKPTRPEPLESTADHELAENKPEKSSGFQLPFFGKKKETKPLDDAIVRAKNNGPADFKQVEVNPLAYCTRIRVKDSNGVNFGSGTIIDSRQGQTLILTCGHILRDSDESTTIEVDIFLGERFETFVGKTIRYDTEADVGIISIPTDVALQTSAIASISQKPEQGNHVFSLGCGGGKPPSKQQLRVTALNRYLGPDNIECTGVPEQGRSGGGLFNLDGQVVGVCIAADPKEKRGLYAGLKAVHELLDQSGLSSLYQQPAGSSPESFFDEKRTRPLPEPAIAANEFLSDESPDVSLGDQEVPAASNFTNEIDKTPNDATVLPDASNIRQEQATANPSIANQVQDALKQAGEAEIVCIIRPLNNPNAASRVVIINRASAKFVADLTGELDAQPQPTTARFRSASATQNHSVFDRENDRSLTRQTAQNHQPARSSNYSLNTNSSRTSAKRFQSDSGRSLPQPIISNSQSSLPVSMKASAENSTASQYRRTRFTR